MSANPTTKIDIILDGAKAIPEANKLEQSMRGYEKAAVSAGAGVQAALNKAEHALAANAQAAIGYDREISVLRKQHVGLQQDIAKLLADGLKREDAEVLALERDMGALTLEMKRLRAEKLALIPETKALNLEHAAAKEAIKQETAEREKANAGINKTSGALGILQGLFTTHTNQISSAGTFWVGYDRAIQTVLASLGFLTVGTSILISLFGIFAVKIFDLIKGKRELLEVDKEGLELDVQRLVAMQSGNLFTRERAAVLRDFTALNVSLHQAIEQLTQAEQKEAAAVAARGEAATRANVTSNEEYLILKLLGQTTEQVTVSQAEATAQRLKAESVVAKQVEQYIKLGVETHRTKDAILAMATATGAEIDVVNALTRALDSALFATIRFKSGQNLISQTRIKVAQDAGAVGETLNRAEAQRRYNAELAKGGEETVKLARETELTEKNLKVFTETTRSGAAAARSLALAENQLTRQVQDARAALIGDDFAARDAKITADINAERAALRIKKQLNSEAMGQLIELEDLRHRKVARDREEAERSVIAKIQELNIRGISDEIDRRRAELEFQMAEERHALEQRFGANAETERLIQDYRRALEAEFNRWRQDALDKVMNHFIVAEQKAANEIFKIREKLVDDSQKSNLLWFKQRGEEEIKLIKQVEQLRKRFLADKAGAGLSESRNFEINLILRGDISKLAEIGLTANDVDKAFGSASLSVEQFDRRVQILTGSGASFIEVLSEIINKQSLLESGINAFTDAIAGAVAGFDSLGHALLVGFFRIIGQIAIQLGTLFVLAAAGFAFIPGLNWSAGALAAAGVAMLAFGAVMMGLASKFSQQGNRAASSGSGATAGASDSGNGRQDRPPTVIPFPTSGGGSNGPGGLSLSLDRQGTKDFLDGKKVVTMDDFRGNGANSSEIQRRTKKMAG